MYLNFITSTSEFIFHGLSVLKRLNLFSCTINADAIAKISDTLEELVLDCVTMIGTQINNGIRLPVHLRLFSVYGNPNHDCLPVITNVDELHDLEILKITIDPGSLSSDSIYLAELDEVTEEFLKIVNTFTLTQLQDFISQLPSSLSSFIINNKGYLKADLDSYDLCCPDKLSLGHITNLKRLDFNCLNNSPTFNVSIFPQSIEVLDFTSSKVLTGAFPTNLITLDINLYWYDESLLYFLNHISNLINLLSLEVKIARYWSIDFRKAKFPVHLCSFGLDFDVDHWGLDNSDPTKLWNSYFGKLLTR
ncbi:unnamed protein product [Ambrosiozyma monospora]|uniref:Unnamed protein product n=1 Tax=Ambrosiozyma monospora TaxID=43982 RepID=A0ACB5TSK2_AMBMO|nr:unnamed protein product [Ambrosiozyma monospora]